MSHRTILGVLISAVLAAAGVRAADDSADVRAHIDAARRVAGSEWARSVDLYCATQQELTASRLMAGPNVPNTPNPFAEPKRVFDNLYFIGQKPVLQWAITTPAGIILIDAGTRERVEDTLLAGFQKLGLNPADIRYVLISHEHIEHVGAAKYLQEQYPSLHVAMSAAAWDGLKEPQPNGQRLDEPKRDMVLKEGTALTLGGESIMPVAIPGHSPGSLGFIVPVRDNGKPHVIGMFNSPVLIPAMSVRFDQYQKSIEHWGEWTRKMDVEGELPNHPSLGRIFEDMAMLDTRKAGQPNPLLVGRASYQNMVKAMSECAKAQLARRS
jgi:metallo-beta-lactamase class B